MTTAIKEVSKMTYVKSIEAFCLSIPDKIRATEFSQFIKCCNDFYKQEIKFLEKYTFSEKKFYVSKFTTDIQSLVALIHSDERYQAQLYGSRVIYLFEKEAKKCVKKPNPS